MDDRRDAGGLESKRFTRNDNAFICAHCGKEVLPMGSSSRNHCPFCLWSLHVDIMPGDRANPCGGQMQPIRSEPDPKHEFVIIHRCTKCGEIRRNRAALNARVQSDNRRLLVRLTAGFVEDEKQ